jgi:ABC-type dipeptide/oligopeptide/nickel transport system permease component
MKSALSLRLLFLLPVCFLLACAAFLFTRFMPGDVLDQLLLRSEGVSVSSADYKHRKEKLAQRMHLDLPLFYFSVSTLAESGSKKYFASQNEEKTYFQLLNANGNIKTVNNYFFFLSEVSGILETKRN